MFSFFRRKKAEPAPSDAPPPTPAADTAAPSAPADDHALGLDDLERQALAAAPQDDAPNLVPPSPDAEAPQGGGFMSRWFGGGAATAPAASPASEPAPPPVAAPDAAPSRPAALPPTAPPPAITTESVRADLAPLIAEKNLELAPASATAEAARVGWMDRLKTGLKRTGSSITTVFTGTQIDDALYDDLETALLMADAGVPATEFLLADLRRRVKDARATHPAEVKALLQDAELDIRGERADGLACDANDVSALPVEVCRRGNVTKIPHEAQELSPLMAFLNQQPVRCRHGLCTRRTGRQDFWNNTTVTDAAAGEFPLAALTVNLPADRVGARYGQYTGALTGSSASPAADTSTTPSSSPDEPRPPASRRVRQMAGTVC